MTKKEKRVGRPATGEPIRRGRMFAATDDEIAEIDRLAKEAGMSRAQFIRYKILGKKE